MKILMRNTVFKTAALAGLFLCVMVLAGAFFGTTASVQATHNQSFIHADQVGTDQEKLEQFVKAAIDAYYLDFLIREHCDFTQISKLQPFQSAIPDLSTASVGEIKPLVALFPTVNLTSGSLPPSRLILP